MGKQRNGRKIINGGSEGLWMKLEAGSWVSKIVVARGVLAI